MCNKFRIPTRFAPLLFGGLLSTIMVSVVSAVVLLLNQGMAPGFAMHWLRSFAVTWPVAFPTVLVVAPRVRNIVACLTAEEAGGRGPRQAPNATPEG